MNILLCEGMGVKLEFSFFCNMCNMVKYISPWTNTKMLASTVVAIVCLAILMALLVSAIVVTAIVFTRLPVESSESSSSSQSSDHHTSSSDHESSSDPYTSSSSHESHESSSSVYSSSEVHSSSSSEHSSSESHESSSDHHSSHESSVYSSSEVHSSSSHYSSSHESSSSIQPYCSHIDVSDSYFNSYNIPAISNAFLVYQTISIASSKSVAIVTGISDTGRKVFFNVPLGENSLIKLPAEKLDGPSIPELYDLSYDPTMYSISSDGNYIIFFDSDPSHTRWVFIRENTESIENKWYTETIYNWVEGTPTTCSMSSKGKVAFIGFLSSHNIGQSILLVINNTNGSFGTGSVLLPIGTSESHRYVMGSAFDEQEEYLAIVLWCDDVLLPSPYIRVAVIWKQDESPYSWNILTVSHPLIDITLSSGYPVGWQIFLKRDVRFDYDNKPPSFVLIMSELSTVDNNPTTVYCYSLNRRYEEEFIVTFLSKLENVPYRTSIAISGSENCLNYVFIGGIDLSSPLPNQSTGIKVYSFNVNQESQYDASLVLVDVVSPFFNWSFDTHRNGYSVGARFDGSLIAMASEDVIALNINTMRMQSFVNSCRTDQLIPLYKNEFQIDYIEHPSGFSATVNILPLNRAVIVIPRKSVLIGTWNEELVFTLEKVSGDTDIAVGGGAGNFNVGTSDVLPSNIIVGSAGEDPPYYFYHSHITDPYNMIQLTYTYPVEGTTLLYLGVAMSSNGIWMASSGWIDRDSLPVIHSEFVIFYTATNQGSPLSHFIDYPSLTPNQHTPISLSIDDYGTTCVFLYRHNEITLFNVLIQDGSIGGFYTAWEKIDELTGVEVDKIKDISRKTGSILKRDVRLDGNASMFYIICKAFEYAVPPVYIFLLNTDEKTITLIQTLEMEPVSYIADISVSGGNCLDVIYAGIPHIGTIRKYKHTTTPQGTPIFEADGELQSAVSTGYSVSANMNGSCVCAIKEIDGLMDAKISVVRFDSSVCTDIDIPINFASTQGPIANQNRSIHSVIDRPHICVPKSKDVIFVTSRLGTLSAGFETIYQGVRTVDGEYEFSQITFELFEPIFVSISFIDSSDDGDKIVVHGVVLNIPSNRQECMVLTRSNPSSTINTWSRQLLDNNGGASISISNTGKTVMVSKYEHNVPEGLVGYLDVYDYNENTNHFDFNFTVPLSPTDQYIVNNSTGLGPVSNLDDFCIVPIIGSDLGVLWLMVVYKFIQFSFPTWIVRYGYIPQLHILNENPSGYYTKMIPEMLTTIDTFSFIYVICLVIDDKSVFRVIRFTPTTLSNDVSVIDTLTVNNATSFAISGENCFTNLFVGLPATDISSPYGKISVYDFNYDGGVNGSLTLKTDIFFNRPHSFGGGISIGVSSDGKKLFAAKFKELLGDTSFSPLYVDFYSSDEYPCQVYYSIYQKICRKNVANGFTEESGIIMPRLQDKIIFVWDSNVGAILYGGLDDEKNCVDYVPLSGFIPSISGSSGPISVTDEGDKITVIDISTNQPYVLFQVFSIADWDYWPLQIEGSTYYSVVTDISPSGNVIVVAYFSDANPHMVVHFFELDDDISVHYTTIKIIHIDLEEPYSYIYAVSVTDNACVVITKEASYSNGDVSFHLFSLDSHEEWYLVSSTNVSLGMYNYNRIESTILPDGRLSPFPFVLIVGAYQSGVYGSVKVYTFSESSQPVFIASLDGPHVIAFSTFGLNCFSGVYLSGHVGYFEEYIFSLDQDDISQSSFTAEGTEWWIDGDIYTSAYSLTGSADGKIVAAASTAEFVLPVVDIFSS